tara:strand:- start:44 stop:199 length:156 start_codon:yes stop_codon:yes gene_type:complete
MNRHQNVLKDMLDELQYIDQDVDEARINALIYAIHVINENEMLKAKIDKRI